MTPKSTHQAIVVVVKLERHPNADSLSLVNALGFPLVVRTSDWSDGDLGVYIPADSLVDTSRREFAFLLDQARADGLARVKGIRLRGEPSVGLLIGAPAGSVVGQDLAEYLGITRYEPPVKGAVVIQGKTIDIGGETEKEPELGTGPSCYDIDAWEPNRHHLILGEKVVITEKLDGANVRYMYWEGRFWVKSRNRWVKQVADYSHVTLESLVGKGISVENAEKVLDRVSRRNAGGVNEFWKPLLENGELQNFLVSHPGVVVYGEIFGNTHRIKYGATQFRAFDVYSNGNFWNYDEFARELDKYGVDRVPVLDICEYSEVAVRSLVSGKTTLEGCNVIREGVVIRPVIERHVGSLGRVILKAVSVDFLALAFGRE